MMSYLYNLATDKYKGFIAGIIKFLLFLLSLIYGLIVRILIFLYRIRPYSLNCKVISVGNITLGGTGKTALVEFIARYLKSQGHKIAILSRGYGRGTRDEGRRTKDEGRGTRDEGRRTKDEGRGTRDEGRRTISYETMGDEPYMLSKKLGDIPVIVDADRIRAAKKAISDYNVDTVILDDGFQQWKIKKDLEIVTIDATTPFGNRYLIPRGILREPLSSLERADMFVLTKTNLNPDIDEIMETLNRRHPAGLIVESSHSPLGFYNINQPDELCAAGLLKEKTVTLFSGIADPDSFESLIKEMGIKIGLSFRFPDHYNYTKKDLDKIIDSSRQRNIDTVITTEKDAQRLHNLQSAICSLQFLILRIRLKITKDEQGFYSRLLNLYSL